MPGETTFTRMPSGAHSWASCWHRTIKAAFAAAYAPPPARGRTPAKELTATNAPRLAFSGSYAALASIHDWHRLLLLASSDLQARRKCVRDHQFRGVNARPSCRWVMARRLIAEAHGPFGFGSRMHRQRRLKRTQAVQRGAHWRFEAGDQSTEMTPLLRVGTFLVQGRALDGERVVPPASAPVFPNLEAGQGDRRFVA